MCRPEDFPPYEPDLKDLQAPTELSEANEVIKALDQMAAEWVTSEEERIAFHTANVGHLVAAVRAEARAQADEEWNPLVGKAALASRRGAFLELREEVAGMTFTVVSNMNWTKAGAMHIDTTNQRGVIDREDVLAAIDRRLT
jgi:hypothetical protein